MGTTVWARHCMEERGWGLSLHFRQLFLSVDEDPTNTEAYRFNLTDLVIPDVKPNYEPECAYFSFPASERCEWCTLHVFSIVKPTTPCNDCADRRLESRRLENHVLQTVHNQPRHHEGYAVNSDYIDIVTLPQPPPALPSPILVV